MSEVPDMLAKRYRLIEKVGTGGMANVYKAQDMVLGRLVAIKLLHPGLTRDQEFVRRFRREAHAAANLAHPNIVTVHDVGQDGAWHFIVMEFVEGRTLKQVIQYYRQRGRPMSMGRAINFTIQICNGIGYAHRAELVHCDVKPQNVIVTRDLQVKVTDFGIARAVSSVDDDLRSEVWGTPQYFSPEQAEGKTPSPASDVYAIGVILYEMLTNRRPFDAHTPTGLAMQHIMDRPVPVDERNPRVPSTLATIVGKVLSKEPAGRYRTAGQLGRILESYRSDRQREFTLGGLGDTTGPLPAIRRREPIEAPSPVQADATLGPDIEPIRSASAHDSSAPIAMVLGLLAVAALLGLIPLWWFVYQRWAALLP